MNEILIDQVYLMQGVWEAKDAKCIDNVLARQIWILIQAISYPDSNGRKVCEYKKFLCLMSNLTPDDPLVLSRLWEYLGKSLASGISIAHPSYNVFI